MTEFLESVKLTPIPAQETSAVSKPPTVKFSLNAHVASLAPAAPSSLPEAPNLDAVLPGEDSTKSRKIAAHVLSVNPTARQLEEDCAKAKEWVKEFVDPGKLPKRTGKLPPPQFPDAIPVSQILALAKHSTITGEDSRPRKATRDQHFIMIAKKPDLDEIKFYPGSKLGPDPEDDPESWVHWYLGNQPSSIYIPGQKWEPRDIFLNETGPLSRGILDKGKLEDYSAGGEGDDAEISKVKEFEMPASDEEDGENGEEEADEDGNSEASQKNNKGTPRMSNPNSKGTHYPVDCTPESFLTTEYDFEKYRTQMPDRDFFESDFPKGHLIAHSPMGDPDHLPIAPRNISPVHEEAFMDVDRWAVFRMMPILMKYKKTFPEMLKELSQDKTIPKDIGIPSVIPYFETLPRWFREHRMAQGFVAGLERYKPELTRLKKEEMLNQLCYYLAPKDPKRLMFLQEHYQKKYMPTADELEVEGDDLEMDFETKKRLGIVEETAEMKVLKILGEESGSRNEDVFEVGEIEDYGVDWFTTDEENTKGKLPNTVTYYDNADGYWDTWIQSRRNRYGAPEIIDRKYFRH